MKSANSIIGCLLVLLALLLTPPLILAAADVDGFKGMRWGSSLPDLLKTRKLVLTKDGGAKGASLYTLENEPLRFGKATLIGIHCSFAQERLQGVILLFKGSKDFAAMKTEALARFGESQKIEQGNEEIYNWVGTVTNSVLSYNRSTQSGFLFMKPKKMPPPVKVAEKRKPPVAVDRETALDKAPPPKVAEKPRPTAPVDWETALDKAPPLPEESAGNAISREAQALIDRDQALTRLCWDTVGPAADAACVQMRENVERLKAMGLCMAPGTEGGSGTEVVWRRCDSQATARTQTGPPPTSPSNAPINQPANAPINDAQHPLCRGVGELFATAARLRDNGVSPATAEEELAEQVTSQIPEITMERIREIVELVYFDQEYSGLWGDPLARQVTERCLSGRGPFAHPLP